MSSPPMAAPPPRASSRGCWSILPPRGSGVSFAIYNTATGTNGITTGGLQALQPGNYASALPAAGTPNGAADINIGNFTTGFTTLSLANTVGFYQSTGINSLTLNQTPASGNAITLANLSVSRIDSGGILDTVSNTIGGSGSITDTLTQAREFIIHTIGAGTTLTINASIGGALVPSTGGLTKDGQGTLILGAAQNAYTGQTSINLGTLQSARRLGQRQRHLLLRHDGSRRERGHIHGQHRAESGRRCGRHPRSQRPQPQHRQRSASAGTLPGTGGSIINTAAPAW